MPYIDDPAFVWPETMAYDVLVQDTAGTLTLITEQPEVEGGGLSESAAAAVEHYRTETGNDVTLVDAWVTGSRMWSTNGLATVPLRPATSDLSGAAE